MNITRKKRTRLYRDIVAQIRQLIQDGSLAPGDQLLPERQLAEKLGVSRSALREALTALDSMGMIDITPGGGAYIRKIGVESLIEPLAAIMLKEKESVYELLEARKIIEVQVAGLAALRASKTELYQIKEAATEMHNDVINNRDAGESDLNFHLAIARASQNGVLYNIMEMLSGLMREAYVPSRNELLRDPVHTQVWCQQNFQIYEAIKNKDPEAASRLIREHINTAEERLRLIDDGEAE
ncbi:lactate-responsive regulator LldR [Desulfocucumis palustris]|uniref:Lactate-responsive regulator LldR n=1 Tax=Desulfocucumis palustris TaxID=1898651 RepID=A0A2L2XDV2_9FIRM|nr:FadR/GntR family transcriptional regulator [Desulfocucumis palustris]GBF32406.1 lactate-responsive regulator LldR [Desulfocucumis palustris]